MRGGQRATLQSKRMEAQEKGRSRKVDFTIFLSSGNLLLFALYVSDNAGLKLYRSIQPTQRRTDSCFFFTLTK
jgi:hypothetical protein